MTFFDTYWTVRRNVASWGNHPRTSAYKILAETLRAWRDLDRVHKNRHNRQVADRGL